jgi:hypothetical protein
MGLSAPISESMLILVGAVLVGILAGVGYMYVTNHGTVLVTAKLNYIHHLNNNNNYIASISVKAKSNYDEPLILRGIILTGAMDNCGQASANSLIIIEYKNNNYVKWAKASVVVNGEGGTDLDRDIQQGKIVLEPNHELDIEILINTACPKIYSGAIQLEFSKFSGEMITFTSNSIDIYK